MAWKVIHYHSPAHYTTHLKKFVDGHESYSCLGGGKKAPDMETAMKPVRKWLGKATKQLSEDGIKFRARLGKMSASVSYTDGEGHKVRTAMNLVYFKEQDFDHQYWVEDETPEQKRNHGRVAV
jgi:hypothetical protein